MTALRPVGPSSAAPADRAPSDGGAPSGGGGFAMAVARNGARIDVALRGELDAYSAPRLVEEMSGLGDVVGRHVVLDLGGVTFVDSAGMAAIVSALRAVKDADGAVTLRALSPQLRKLFEITGLSRLFPVE